MNKYKSYLTKLADALVRTLILVVITIIVFSIILILCNIMWSSYQYTHIGQKFAEFYPERAAVISDILDVNILLLAFDVTYYAFIICIVLGALAQLTSITRLLYTPRGGLGRLVFFGLPITSLVAMPLQQLYTLASLEQAYVLALIPTLCMVQHCFNYTYWLIPSIVDVIRLIDFKGLKSQIRGVIDRINAS